MEVGTAKGDSPELKAELGCLNGAGKCHEWPEKKVGFGGRREGRGKFEKSKTKDDEEASLDSHRWLSEGLPPEDALKRQNRCWNGGE